MSCPVPTSAGLLPPPAGIGCILQKNLFGTGAGRPSSANALAELDCLSLPNKRKGKGGRQPAMDPRLDPNVDPKRAKRILANRLSAARSKMKQKSHVEVSLVRMAL